jgi:hypothetical protein
MAMQVEVTQVTTLTLTINTLRIRHMVERVAQGESVETVPPMQALRKVAQEE